MNDDVIAICCKDVAEEFDFPSDAVVVADFVDPHNAYVVGREEFMEFLEECAVIFRRDPS